MSLGCIDRTAKYTTGLPGLQGFVSSKMSVQKCNDTADHISSFVLSRWLNRQPTFLPTDNLFDVCKPLNLLPSHHMLPGYA